MKICLRRREFIAALGGAAAWPLAARAQRPPATVIGYLSTGLADLDSLSGRAFRKGLSEAGFIEGRNLAIEYRFAENNFSQLPDLAADLVSTEWPSSRFRMAALRQPLRRKPPPPRFRSFSVPAETQSKWDWSPVSIDRAAMSPALPS